MQNLDFSTRFVSEMQVQRVHNGAECSLTDGGDDDGVDETGGHTEFEQDDL